MDDVSKEATEAAAKSIQDDDPRITESDAYDLASNALTAALPHIRKQIAAAIQRRKRDLAEGYSDISLAMLEAGMEEAARIAEEGTTK